MLDQLTAGDVSQVSNLWRVRRDTARLHLMRQPAHPSAAVWRMQTRVLTYMLRRYCGEYVAPDAIASPPDFRFSWAGRVFSTLGRCAHCACRHRRIGRYCHNCGRSRHREGSSTDVLNALASVRRASNIACAWTAIVILLMTLSFGSIVVPAILEGR